METIDWKNQFTSLIREVYETERQKNAVLSLRSFAKSIKTPASTVSEIINGKLCLNAKRAAQVVEQLPLSRNRKNYFLTILEQPFELERETFKDEDYLLLTDWRYLAILHFFDVEAVVKTPEMIARRLELAVDDVKRIIDELVHKDLLVREESGELKATKKNWQNPTGKLPTEVIQSFHKENLKCAVRALETVDAKERDFSTTVFAGNSEQMELIRQELRRIHKRVVSIGEGGGTRDRLYSLSVSFFPMDKQV